MLRYKICRHMSFTFSAQIIYSTFIIQTQMRGISNKKVGSNRRIIEFFYRTNLPLTLYELASLLILEAVAVEIIKRHILYFKWQLISLQLLTKRYYNIYKHIYIYIYTKRYYNICKHTRTHTHTYIYIYIYNFFV